MASLGCCRSKEMLDAFLRHRRKSSRGAPYSNCAKARERGHILEGLAIALANIDAINRGHQASPSPAEAKVALMSRPWASGAVSRNAGPRRRDQHSARKETSGSASSQAAIC